jgi:hypothetical protein
MLLNVKGKVIEVEGNRDVEGNGITMGNKSRARHQQWNIVYSDKETEI